MLRILATAGLLGSLIAGCNPPPDFVTAYGVAVYTHGQGWLDQTEAEEMEWYVVATLPRVRDYPRDEVEDCLSEAVVELITDPMHCGFKCAGDQHGNLLHVLEATCHWESAYVHELLHWMQECVDRTYDPNHVESEVWAVNAERPLLCE